ncbi:MAG: RluA family pseudouridine synthase, partial [Clostridiales Family XIII bacterium]|nr:RluA family pseudouridine synthase [Clostridiales Family XIII bacterium]
SAPLHVEIMLSRLYNILMEKIIITEDEGDQRLDRFLKKYLRNAPLSLIYKMIRKDVKVNGRRVELSRQLNAGDELCLYVADGELAAYAGRRPEAKAKRQFKVAYEDANLLIAEKPLGLLTHGDRVEKKNTLANQVVAYLSEQGSFKPGRRDTFAPSPVNRLDRNTTGLVIFGKTHAAVKTLNRMVQERGFIRKFYLTVVKGIIRDSSELQHVMRKNRAKNMVGAAPAGQSDDMKDAAGGGPGACGRDAGSKYMETLIRPVKTGKGYTLVEAELVTGRTHQIRAQLAAASFPVIGDPKYGDPAVNARINGQFGLSSQFLHAHKLVFEDAEDELAYLKGLVVTAPLPPSMGIIEAALFGGA